MFKRSKSKVTVEQKRELITSLIDKNHKDSQKEVSSFFNIPVVVKTKKTMQSDGSVRVELTLSKELAEQIERAQALLSHAVPSADLVDYLDYVTKRVIQQKTSVRKNKSTTTVVVDPNTDREVRLKQGKNVPVEITSTGMKSPELASSCMSPSSMAPTGMTSSCVASSGVTPSCVTPSSTTLSGISSSTTTVVVDSNTKSSLRNCSFKNQISKSKSSHAFTNPLTTTMVAKGFSAKQKKIVLNQNSRCMHKDHNTGQVCGGRWFLQVDHRQSLWAGGTNDLQNAQVLCAHHNQEKYRRESHTRIV